MPLHQLAMAGLSTALTLGVVACSPAPQQSGDLQFEQIFSDEGRGGYARAKKRREFIFPADHGAHNEFRSEWWYVTGNLSAENGAQFGFQVTFFRFANSAQAPNRESNWAASHSWMAHVALSDIDNEKHLFEERFARGAAGLAGVSLSPFRLWLDDWRITGSNDFPWNIHIKADKMELDLALVPQKPIVLQGDKGLSQKSSEPGNASYYYSITRLQTSGSITIDNALHSVTGLSWLDREWGTTALDEHQAGWDWFSIQLDDGRDLMYYQIRKKNGEPDITSQGVLVARNGGYTPIALDEVTLVPQTYWTSTHGADYPIRWIMRIPKIGVDWIIEATIPEQLMDLSVRYWEGSIRIVDKRTNARIGRGYLELTGY